MVLQANEMLGMQKIHFSDSVKTLQRKISEYINVSILSSCKLPGTGCHVTLPLSLVGSNYLTKTESSIIL